MPLGTPLPHRPVDPPVHHTDRCVSTVRLKDGVCWVDRAVADQCGVLGDPESIATLLDTLLNPHTPAIQVFKDDSRSRVCVVQGHGRAWVVKRYRLPRWKTWAYHVFRLTPAWREWLGSHRLALAGCCVSRPLALVHQRGHRSTGQTLILSLAPGQSLYHVLADSKPPTNRSNADRRLRRRIAQAIGQQIGKMTAAGIINRDLKPSNWVIDSAGGDAGDPQAVMIDPAGLRRRRGDQQVYAMLAGFLCATQEPGGVTLREAVACLKAVLQADPSIAERERLRLNAAARSIWRTIDESQSVSFLVNR